MPLAPGTVIAGRYTLEEELGRGATAVVWLATDAQGDRPVALKVLHEELAEPSVRERFAREARRTAEFTHERILPVLDTGDANGTPFFVQPYMSGGTLRGRLRRERQLSIEETVRIGRDLARALAHAHARGYVHRDVKPENILFRDGEAYLGDFGICRAIAETLDESSTSRLVVRGTPAYMSPEQASGTDDLDGRSDLFSLGSVLYECLTGVPAFIGATDSAIIAQVIGQSPRDISIFRPSVSTALAEIIATCHRREPSDRFRDANALAEALGNPERRNRPSGDAAVVPRVRARVLLAVAAVVAMVATIGAIVAQTLGSGPVAAEVALDTTHLALFPLERDTGDTIGDAVDDDLLRAAFQRGEGISLVSQLMIADRLRQGDGGRDSERLLAIARDLGAGRFVRGRLESHGATRRAILALHDAATGQVLMEHEAEVPGDPAAAAASYAAVAATLLVRGRSDDADVESLRPRWSIPALQAYRRGQQALEDWDLPAADSSFQRAQSFDPGDPRIQFALAQTRAWARQPARLWRDLATRAAEAADSLAPRERRLAFALRALGAREFAAACAQYDSLRRSDPNDHAAWFGLGQCHSSDDVVVPDSVHSPSGWRFRSSHQQAFVAFERALTLLPSMHRGLRREGFDTKGIYTLRPSDVRIGRSEDRTRIFGARIARMGDTLAMIPYPIEALASSGSTVPAGFVEAIESQRERFAAMALGWSSVFPEGSEAKEAVALALEMRGLRAAIDTIRLARTLARRAKVPMADQLALGAAEVRMLVRFGLPDAPELLASASILADSLLALPEAEVALVAEEFELLAVILGRCDAAVRYARARSGDNLLSVPEALLLESRELLARAVLRCDPAGDARRAHDYLGRLDAHPAARDPNARRSILHSTFFRPALMLDPADMALTRRVAQETNDPLASAAAALGSDREAVRRGLRAFEAVGHEALPMSPDYAFIYARVWAGLGDTTAATAILDRALNRVRFADTEDLRETGNLGALLRMAQWRGELAEAAKDRRTARRWQAAIRALQDN